MTVTVVVPAFNEEESIRTLIHSLVPLLSVYEAYEILVVDDGSTDRTLTILKQLHGENGRIRYISLSRNFGHQVALKAGLDCSLGDCVISMDADMQHPPALIAPMVAKYLEGFDIVVSVRKDDADLPFAKRITSASFYKVMALISDVEIKPGTADFRLMSRPVVEVLKNMGESFLFIRGLVPWLGFRQASIEYVPGKRYSGATKYSFGKMLSLALSGMTSFSIRPLRLSTYLGLIISLLTFFYALYAVSVFVFTNEAVSGWTSVIASVLFIGGIQLVMLGIIGEYLGKVFIQSKGRPNYIIKEKTELQ